jgi:coenzyme F420-reducing hydrogenase delta subunit
MLISQKSNMNNQELKIHVFYCTNGLEQDQAAQICSGPDRVTFKTISLPCSGKIDIPYLVKAFETGADGVAIVTCKQGECQHLEGNLRARKRAEAVESLLEEIGMGRGRMALIMLTDGGVQQAAAEIKSFIDRVRNLPRTQAQSSAVNV